MRWAVALILVAACGHPGGRPGTEDPSDPADTAGTATADPERYRFSDFEREIRSAATERERAAVRADLLFVAAFLRAGPLADRIAEIEGPGLPPCRSGAEEASDACLAAIYREAAAGLRHVGAEPAHADVLEGAARGFGDRWVRLRAIDAGLRAGGRPAAAAAVLGLRDAVTATGAVASAPPEEATLALLRSAPVPCPDAVREALETGRVAEALLRSDSPECSPVCPERRESATEPLAMVRAGQRCPRTYFGVISDGARAVFAGMPGNYAAFRTVKRFARLLDVVDSPRTRLGATLGRALRDGGVREYLEALHFPLALPRTMEVGEVRVTVPAAETGGPRAPWSPLYAIVTSGGVRLGATPVLGFDGDAVLRGTLPPGEPAATGGDMDAESVRAGLSEVLAAVPARRAPGGPDGDGGSDGPDEVPGWLREGPEPPVGVLVLADAEAPADAVLATASAIAGHGPVDRPGGRGTARPVPHLAIVDADGRPGEIVLDGGPEDRRGVTVGAGLAIRDDGVRLTAPDGDAREVAPDALADAVDAFDLVRGSTAGPELVVEAGDGVDAGRLATVLARVADRFRYVVEGDASGVADRERPGEVWSIRWTGSVSGDDTEDDAECDGSARVLWDGDAGVLEWWPATLACEGERAEAIVVLHGTGAEPARLTRTDDGWDVGAGEGASIECDVTARARGSRPPGRVRLRCRAERPCGGDGCRHEVDYRLRPQGPRRNKSVAPRAPVRRARKAPGSRNSRAISGFWQRSERGAQAAECRSYFCAGPQAPTAR